MLRCAVIAALRQQGGQQAAALPAAAAAAATSAGRWAAAAGSPSLQLRGLFGGLASTDLSTVLGSGGVEPHSPAFKANRAAMDNLIAQLDQGGWLAGWRALQLPLARVLRPGCCMPLLLLQAPLDCCLSSWQLRHRPPSPRPLVALLPCKLTADALPRSTSPCRSLPSSPLHTNSPSLSAPSPLQRIMPCRLSNPCCRHCPRAGGGRPQGGAAAPSARQAAAQVCCARVLMCLLHVTIGAADARGASKAGCRPAEQPGRYTCLPPLLLWKAVVAADGCCRCCCCCAWTGSHHPTCIALQGVPRTAAGWQVSVPSSLQPPFLPVLMPLHPTCNPSQGAHQGAAGLRAGHRPSQLATEAPILCLY